MNSARRQSEQKQPQQETWPHKLNKALIAIGVIAFGLIVTDRIIEMFGADDAPDVTAEVERIEFVEPTSPISSQSGVSQSNAEIVDVSTASTEIADPAPEVESPSLIIDALVKSEGEAEIAVDLQDLFGSRVVFVSASDPVYVVTEDDRRFEVGSEIDAQTTLAGITAQQLILEHAGDLTVISLPDPIVQ